MMSQCRFTTWSAICFMLLTLSGCEYMRDRGNDAKDIADIGLTFTDTPQFAFYASGPIVQVFTLGAGNVDGKFLGLGEGRFSAMGPHYEKSGGTFLWGEERISYYYTGEELDAMTPEEADEKANFMRVGILGMAEGPPPDLKYIGSCPHYLHLGFIGLVGTPRYLQFADFLLGWTTLDVCQDDGRD